MIGDNPSEAYEVVRSEPDPLPPLAVDVTFLISASELRDRKTKGDESTIYPSATKPSAGLSRSG